MGIAGAVVGFMIGTTASLMFIPEAGDPDFERKIQRHSKWWIPFSFACAIAGYIIAPYINFVR